MGMRYSAHKGSKSAQIKTDSVFSPLLNMSRNKTCIRDYSYTFRRHWVFIMGGKSDRDTYRYDKKCSCGAADIIGHPWFTESSNNSNMAAILAYQDKDGSLVLRRRLCFKARTLIMLIAAILVFPPQVANFPSALSPQIVIIEHKSIICPGYNAVLHIHTCIEEVQITVSRSLYTFHPFFFVCWSCCTDIVAAAAVLRALWTWSWKLCKSHVQALICLVDKKTGEKSKTRPRFVKQDQVCIARLRAAGVICLETFKDFPQMGRFTLRDEGGGRSSLYYLSLKLIDNVWLEVVVVLPPARPSYRKNYRHWQSAEAGAREGLTAAEGDVHKVL